MASRERFQAVAVAVSCPDELVRRSGWNRKTCVPKVFGGVGAL